MRVFIGGIIQGSKPQELVHDQSYREQIADALRTAYPDVEVIDPHGRHPERFDFDLAAKRDLFLKYVAEAGKVDLFVAYLPEASMGTAVEMWVAHEAGVPIYTVSPLCQNWVVFSLSTKVFGSIGELRRHLGERDA
jgi:hypothetical protein